MAAQTERDNNAMRDVRVHIDEQRRDVSPRGEDFYDWLLQPDHDTPKPADAKPQPSAAAAPVGVLPAKQQGDVAFKSHMQEDITLLLYPLDAFHGLLANRHHAGGQPTVAELHDGGDPFLRYVRSVASDDAGERGYLGAAVDRAYEAVAAGAGVVSKVYNWFGGAGAPAYG